ncbi:putative beta-lactamase [Lyophyllum shimeji]|uniref:Beta-lactamase n=1 Tax=Lyophyllum shimeji TaxID=47721 RepID=A0A9P3PJZ6_LYOSH|nr:putative beta-lactamase [Lyophyllum shimeji]
MYSRTFCNLLALYFLHAFLAVVGVSAQGTNTPLLDDDVEALVNKVLADFNSPTGIAIGVVRKDQQGAWNVETKGYGMAKLDGTKVTENTLFAIASNSKLFTALATGLLIHNETLSPRLTWQSKIGSIIPDWGLMDPYASNHSTIVDLLSHRTGLPRHDMMARETDDVTDIVKRLRYLRPSTEPRVQWQYSNLMYITLSSLPHYMLNTPIPNKTGQLADGLTRQDVNVTENPFGNGTVRALPYYVKKDTEALVGPGGVISNVIDMCKWLQTLLSRGGKPGTEQIIFPGDILDTLESGISVWYPTAAFPELSPVVYGGGLGSGTYRGHVMIEHGGNVPGYNSQITRFPDDKFGIVVMSNADSYGGPICEAIKYHIVDKAFGLKPVDWSSRYRSGIISSLKGATPPNPRPANATLPPNGFSALAGTYHNAGYGTLEVCLVTPSSSNDASPTCNDLVANASTILPGQIDPAIPTFLIPVDSPYLTHLKLTHFNGSIFNFHILRSYPTGDTNGTTWAADPDPFSPHTIEFADGGFGFQGIWAVGDPTVPPATGNTPKERAEVRFDKTG